MGTVFSKHIEPFPNKMCIVTNHLIQLNWVWPPTKATSSIHQLLLVERKVCFYNKCHSRQVVLYCTLLQIGIYLMGHSFNLLESESPSGQVYVWVYVWISLQCANLIVCVKECLAICVCMHAVWICVYSCSICVFVLPGCVWLCQAIWSAVWGAHYPLSSAVGSGALSICPSSFSHPSHPPRLSLCFLLIFIFCFTSIFYFSYLLAWSLFFPFLFSHSTFLTCAYPQHNPKVVLPLYLSDCKYVFLFLVSGMHNIYCTYLSVNVIFSVYIIFSQIATLRHAESTGYKLIVKYKNVLLLLAMIVK